MAVGADVPGMSVVVYAKDVQRLGAFYQAVLGIPADWSEPGFAVLEGPGWQLVVPAIPAPHADTIVITDPPELREDGAVKPVFPVADLAAARAAASTHGGGLAGPEREWAFRGTVRCDGHDPEGNVLQLSTAPPPART